MMVKAPGYPRHNVTLHSPNADGLIAWIECQTTEGPQDMCVVGPERDTFIPDRLGRFCWERTWEYVPWPPTREIGFG